MRQKMMVAVCSIILSMTTIVKAEDYSGSADEKAAAIAVVQKLFDAMATSDAETAQSIIMPDARFVAIPKANDTGFRLSKGGDFAAGIANWPQGMVESMINPSAMVRGRMAVVWAPFVFHRQETLSHCGVNTVVLIHTDGDWKVSDITYTHETDVCEAMAAQK